MKSSYARRLRAEQLEDRRMLATFTVSNLMDGPVAAADDLPGSLRQAIFDAKASAGADTIDFSIAGTIELDDESGQLTIDTPLTINGGNQITLDARGGGDMVGNGNGFRIFNIDDGDENNDISVTLSGLTLTGGDVGGSNTGGAVRNLEMLTITDSTITGNSANNDGGGIFNQGVLNVTDSTISDNTANNNNSSDGGGIHNVNGEVTVMRSTISGNSAEDGGGGIYSTGGRVTITDSTISGNTAEGDDGGGGIFNTGYLNTPLAVEVSNTTISGNTALSGPGGGLFNTTAVTEIAQSTITANTAPENQGSGVASFGSLFTITRVSGTIIAGNTNDDVAVIDNNTNDNSFDSDDHNLIGSGAPFGIGPTGNTLDDFNGQNDQINVADPRLGPLADNGGPTQTHALLPGSPAIDAGMSDVMFDQRGLDRDDGNGVDIGAFEAQETPSLIVTTTTDVVDETDGVTSLREAIRFANLLPGADTITFSSLFNDSQTILLTSQLPTITDGLTIIGPGQTLLTLDAGNGADDEFGTGDGFRIINIDDGDNNVEITVSLGGLTLTGGDPAGNDLMGHGGAICSLENLTVTGSTINGNNARLDGGAISSFFGDLTITGSTVSGNNARDSGGIYSSNGGLTITGSTISGNNARYYGGGIYSSNGDLTITGSTISGNEGREGGGIRVNRGTATINSSNISGNEAGRDGGGIFLIIGTAAITNSTISGNVAGDNGGGIRNLNTATITNSTISDNVAGDEGGGIFNSNTATINSSTISGNEAGGSGGGVFNASVGNATITNSIVAGNTAGGNGENVQDFGDFNDSESNLIGGDPLLGPLADNGGPTQTHALLPGSPALNAGVAANIAPLGTASQSSGFNNGQFPAELAIDGNFDNFTATDSNDVDPFFLPTFDTDQLFNEIVLHNRADFEERLRDITVEVLDSGDEVVFASDLLNPNNSLNDPATITVTLPTPELGRMVRVRRTSDPNGANADDSNILTLAEIEVFAADQRGFARNADGGQGGTVDIGAYEAQAVPTAAPGDYNRDGTVDAADYTVWRDALGTSVPALTGADGDGDGQVTVTDYNVWRSHFGFQFTPPPQNVTVHAAAPVVEAAAPALEDTPARNAPATEAAFALIAPPGERDQATESPIAEEAPVILLHDDNLLLLALDQAVESPAQDPITDPFEEAETEEAAEEALALALGSFE